MITESGQPVVFVRNIEVDFNGEAINLVCQYPDEDLELKKLDAFVRACDESLLPRDGYRQLNLILFVNIVLENIELKLRI